MEPGPSVSVGLAQITQSERPACDRWGGFDPFVTSQPLLLGDVMVALCVSFRNMAPNRVGWRKRQL